VSRGWIGGAVGTLGIALTAVWPLTPALAARDVLQARLVSAALVAGVCAVVPLTRGVRSIVWTVTGLVCGIAGVVLLLLFAAATGACVVDDYPGGAAIIGSRYTRFGEQYARDHPEESPKDLLLAAASDAERMWTTSSIARCRFLVGWGGLLTVPLFATSIVALIARRSSPVLGAPAPFTRPSVALSASGRPVPVYDAFLSYRHLEPDRTYAVRLLEELEGRGLKVAIDARDFAPNAHFLSEMERCITQSRFVLCVLTARYIESDHTSEEAIISKTLDMADRQQRIVPLKFEAVALPVWLHGLVGIDFSASADVDPMERLLGMLTRDPAVTRL
jgi:hypothetical protein